MGNTENLHPELEGLEGIVNIDTASEEEIQKSYNDIS